jgi:UDP-N-acetylglucosamine 2-epimerase (non-hydrolysing)
VVENTAFVGKRFRVLSVCGTRPDTVKMAPVVLEIQRHPEQVESVLAVTGQHKEMLTQVLGTFDLHPQFNLGIMTKTQTLSQITTRCLEGLEKVVSEVAPDLVLAQGDTTTTFAASLCAFYAKVPFGHVEAGLRTDNKFDPFPEEMNRRLTAVLADLHFAPTDAARGNLLAQSVRAEDIFVTGNTGIDALLTVASRDHQFSDPRVADAAASGKMILITAHRRENWGERMGRICDAVKELLAKHPDYTVVFPMHKNPIVRDTVVPALGNLPGVVLVEPPEYAEFIHLMKSARIVLTDSGGVQEEAPSLGKPVLVLRETTERPEGVEAGSARLVGTSVEAIVSLADALLSDSTEYTRMSQMRNPYGDGKAAKRIWEIIEDRFGLS